MNSEVFGLHDARIHQDLFQVKYSVTAPLDLTPVAIAGVRWLVFLRLFVKTKTAYGGQLATFVIRFHSSKENPVGYL